MGEIMFETFNVPGLYIVENYALALAFGIAVVASVGDGAAHILPVVDGYVIGRSIKPIPIVGKDVLSLYSNGCGFAPRHAYVLRLSARKQKHPDPSRRGVFD
ncbi:hypothetical protein Goklo_004222 [Gossypium klotzschianum]|uniref:Uncharacterized protein n=1 Tax=Gossypium klotzschianum TaxID=34286 RepID=A0A7J8VMZ6_9ROSI|nr:hypothetical protein [Gossypium klotzschianum]